MLLVGIMMTAYEKFGSIVFRKWSSLRCFDDGNRLFKATDQKPSASRNRQNQEDPTSGIRRAIPLTNGTT